LSKSVDDFEITEDIILKSSGVVDVFSNEFDITFFNEFPPGQEPPRKFSQLPFGHEGGVDDGLVSYEYNSDFFRCDDFTTKHSEKYHIVFGGCSETEGVGGNLNELWSYNLYLELKEKYDIGGYYSLAKSGNGWHKVALSLINYVEKYGAPTHFFVMLPNIGRNFYWDKEDKIWRYLQKYANRPFPRKFIQGDKINKTYSPHPEKNLFNTDEYKRQYMEFAVGWKMLIAYCKSNNIKILYSTWCHEDNENLKKIDGQNKIFIPLDRYDCMYFISKLDPKINDIKKMLNKRDGHSGSAIHKYWTSVFIKEIEKRKLFDD
jgi:hypothetical protein